MKKYALRLQLAPGPPRFLLIVFERWESRHGARIARSIDIIPNATVATQVAFLRREGVLRPLANLLSSPA